MERRGALGMGKEYSSEFKLEVALIALKEELTTAEMRYRGV